MLFVQHIKKCQIILHKYSKIDALTFLIIYYCRFNCAIIGIIFRKCSDICDSFQQ